MAQRSNRSRMLHDRAWRTDHSLSDIIPSMKSSSVEQKALELPVANRARLAHRLLESLDQLSAEEAEMFWLNEADRRAREIDDGKVRLVTADELERRVQARLK